MKNLLFEFEFEYIAAIMTMMTMVGGIGGIVFQRILFDYTLGNNFHIVIKHVFPCCIFYALDGRSY